MRGVELIHINYNGKDVWSLCDKRRSAQVTFRPCSWVISYVGVYHEMFGIVMTCQAFRVMAALLVAGFLAFAAVTPAYAGCMPVGSAGGLISKNGLVPGRVAVNKAQSKGGGKVIKIVLCQNGNNFVYRATVLGKQGAVKNITVNAKTGQ